MVDEGQTTTLQCDAIHSHLQTLAWIKNSIILRQMNLTTYNLSYTIISATKDHAGIYTCKVIAAPGLPEQYSTSYNVTVKVRCKLSIWTCRRFVVISISDKHYLQCFLAIAVVVVFFFSITFSQASSETLW